MCCTITNNCLWSGGGPPCTAVEGGTERAAYNVTQSFAATQQEGRTFAVPAGSPEPRAKPTRAPQAASSRPPPSTLAGTAPPAFHDIAQALYQ